MYVCAVSALSGCLSVSTPPSPPLGPLSQKLHASDDYCGQVQSQLNDRKGLRALQTLSSGMVVLGGAVGVVSGGLFIDRASDDSSSTDRVARTGYVALTSTIVATVGAALYGYSSKEIEARRNAAAEISKARTLSAQIQIDFEAAEKTAAGVDPTKADLPMTVQNGCYQVAIDQEVRSQGAVDALIKDMGERLRKAQETAKTAEFQLQQFKAGISVK